MQKKINLAVEHYCHFKLLWTVCKRGIPVAGRKYSVREKRKKEKEFDASISGWRNYYIRYSTTGEMDETFIMREMMACLRDGFGYDSSDLDIIFSSGMVGATQEFIKEARHFDATISVEDMMQACRNVWIMNGIQYVLKQEVKLTPSMFAYSMLYPYSDNLLDNPGMTKQNKMEFSSRFEARLRGETVQAVSPLEEKIYCLVGIIEDEWDRRSFPGVYDSLLHIHKAQTDSLSLLAGNQLSEEDIFRICVEKGGASVVADGYLLSGMLNNGQKQFLYDYGAYLQLIDDLQDVTDDLEDGINTCFSSIVGKGHNLDEITQQTNLLASFVIDELDWMNDSYGFPDFKSLLKKSFDLFFTGLLVINAPYYSRDFKRKMENYAPFHFAYAEKRLKKLAPYKGILIRNMEQFIESKITKNYQPVLLSV